MRSFILTTEANSEILESCIVNAENVDYTKLNGFIIATFGPCGVNSRNENLSARIIILGQILNEQEILCIANTLSKGIFILDISVAILTLLEVCGAEAIDFMEGNFAILLCEKDLIRLYTNSSPTYPIYCYTKDSLYISNQVKYISQISTVNSDIIPLEEYNPKFQHKQDFTLFKYIRKISPRSVLTVSTSDYTSNIIRTRKLWVPKYNTFDVDFKRIHSVLEYLFIANLNQVISYFRNMDSIAIALSGGVDSSVVGAYARTINPQIKIHCYTTGAESSVEFDYAKICSDYIGGQHYQIKIDQNGLIGDIVNMIYHNEMFDAFSLEVYASLCSIHRKSKDYSNVLLTGVGADNIMSGFTGDTISSDGINHTLFSSARAYWSGAMLPYCAWSEGVMEYSPFMSTKLVSFFRGISPDIKNYNNTNKYLLKSLAQDRKLVPHENIWRKKIRLEQGNEAVELFADFLSIKTDQYKKKHRFVYEVFKEVFCNKQSLSVIDVYKIANSI